MPQLLPKLDTPTYELTLPSTNKSLKYRPFLVREEKILLMATESGDRREMLEALKNLISNCVLSDIDVESLPMFDVEYIFLQLRSKSMGETVDLEFKIKSCEEKDPPCKNTIKTTVNIEDIQIKHTDNHTNKIEITDNISLQMKYPSIGSTPIDSINEDNEEPSVEAVFDTIMNCMEYIIDGDNAIPASDCSREELMEFLESMTSDQFAKVNEFFGTMPKISHTLDVVCPDCGATDSITIEGFENFFG